MTKEQEKAFFNADIDTNTHGKREIEKDRKVPKPSLPHLTPSISNTLSFTSV